MSCPKAISCRFSELDRAPGAQETVSKPPSRPLECSRAHSPAPASYILAVSYKGTRLCAPTDLKLGTWN